MSSRPHNVVTNSPFAELIIDELMSKLMHVHSVEEYPKDQMDWLLEMLQKHTTELEAKITYEASGWDSSGAVRLSPTGEIFSKQWSRDEILKQFESESTPDQDFHALLQRAVTDDLTLGFVDHVRECIETLQSEIVG